jgi:hypothetical protein
MPEHPATPSTRTALTLDDRRATFDRQAKVMKMFSDNAKIYIQLSGAALGLTLTFAQKVLHLPDGKGIVNPWTIAMWLCFLLAIITGAFYQYLATKFVETFLDWATFQGWSWLPPGIVYGVMLLAFYAGTIIFTIYAIVRLTHL